MIVNTASYDYDDLLLVPRPSMVNSREDVDLSVDLGKLKLKYPIIASPMKGISSVELIVEVDRVGGIGILHRFHDSYDRRANEIMTLARSCDYWGAAVGLNEDIIYSHGIIDFGASIICVDIANGYLESLKRECEKIASWSSRGNYNCLLMAGNVVTYEGAKELKDCGVDLIRVGIGSGQLCTTRKVTGVGYPQLSAIDDCAYSDAFIVADGGIRNSGDCTKALAAGADLLMLGSMFGRCKESSHNGIIYGMASKRLQEEYFHNTKSIEGIEKEVDKDITVEELINSLVWGMRSAFTYLNARNIKELQGNARWVES